MKKVLVLMSCYNGAHFLEEQLNSLLHQKDVDVEILVRDDGSTDETREILKKYESKCALKWYTGENIGWRRSFMHLALNAPDCEYYAFSDQDDVWLPNKLSDAITNIENNSDVNDLTLYFSNLFIWKNGTNCGLLRQSLPKYTRFSCIYQNVATGCTLVFNKKFLDFIKKRPFEDVYAHDLWFFQTAVFFGKVIYNPSSFILYRQHENNQIGVKKGFCNKINRIMKNFKENEGITRSQNALNFLKIYKDDLSPDDYKLIDIVANYKKSLLKKLSFLFSRKYTMNNLISTVILKIRVLFNRF